MKVFVAFKTTNKSIHVTTLHCILKLNKIAIDNNVHTQLNFVENFLKTEDIKNFDRVVVMDYSVSVDPESLLVMCKPFPNDYDCVVFPCLENGINWSVFRDKVKGESKEPIEQMGMTFDTDVDDKIEEGFWNVKSTNPKAYVIKADKFVDFVNGVRSDIKICAYTKSSTTVTYTQECIGNILESCDITEV